MSILTKYIKWIRWLTRLIQVGLGLQLLNMFNKWCRFGSRLFQPVYYQLKHEYDPPVNHTQSQTRSTPWIQNGSTRMKNSSGHISHICILFQHCNMNSLISPVGKVADWIEFQVPMLVHEITQIFVGFGQSKVYVQVRYILLIG